MCVVMCACVPGWVWVHHVQLSTYVCMCFCLQLAVACFRETTYHNVPHSSSFFFPVILFSDLPAHKCSYPLQLPLSLHCSLLLSPSLLFTLSHSHATHAPPPSSHSSLMLTFWPTKAEWMKSCRRSKPLEMPITFSLLRLRTGDRS